MHAVGSGSAPGAHHQMITNFKRGEGREEKEIIEKLTQSTGAQRAKQWIVGDAVGCTQEQGLLKQSREATARLPCVTSSWH